MEDNVDETIDAFDSLKKDGLIRQYGISSIRPTVIQRFLDNSSAISVMMQYSLLDRRPEEWFPMIQQAGASVVARGTIAKGLLTAEGLARAEQANGFVDYDAAELTRTVQALSEQSADLHAAAIAHVLHDQTVASALIGARTTKQLLDSVVAYDNLVTDEEIAQVQRIVQLHTYREHRL